MFFTTLKRQDWFLNLAVALLALSSLVILNSISPDLFRSQVVWFLIGGFFIILFSQADLRPFGTYRWVILGVYCLAILLLILTVTCVPGLGCLGTKVRGTRGWLGFGALRFQTAEFAKLALLIFFSYFFARRHVGIGYLHTIAISLFYLLVPVGLILLQPDAGSAMVLIGLWIGFLLVSGIHSRHLILGFLLFLVLAGIGWNFLQDYQRERIFGFLDPNYDPQGINYNVIQSKIAIGSAGWLGKGFGQGTQVHLKFLPEPSTDFILSAFIEEWGYLGGIFVIGVFMFLLIRIVVIGLRAETNFFRFICMGAVIMFLIQFILNVGSALGVLPVVGVTFPLLSYGGSSLLTNALLIGIIQSIAVSNSR